MGWCGAILLGESQSHIYPNNYVCQIWSRSDSRVERGGGGTDRQTDIQRDTAALYSR